MKKLLIIFTLTSLISCSTTKSGTQEIATDSTYGYSKENPIKVGGNTNGPANEQKFLSSLSGPNGEELWYKRSGSCCSFETRNSSFGMGMLDVYKVTYEGKKDTLTLYFNMYDKVKPKAPLGLKFKK
ncbi:2-dehydro-3-deoxyphosphooctonate aldolase [Flavobacterium sp. CAU 1735]|uniref:2-dehydro-3-deoxyphosphooctonate aldolase n=1 Tax=Flavobacterium sp. CAU 1735 TaxID=3140361 RepID=UPI003260D6BC